MTTALFVFRNLAFGGAERLSADILQALHDRGVRTIAATVEPWRSATADSGDAWFADHTELRRPVGQATVDLREVIATERVDTLVFSGKSRAYAWLPAIKSAFPGLRVSGFMFNALQLVWEHRRYGAYFDAIIAESTEAARALNGEGDDRLPIRVIPSGIDVHAIAARPIVRHPSRPLTVAYVGRFDRSKNPRAFVEMAKGLRGDGLHFVMIGPAPSSFRAPADVHMAGLLIGEAKEKLFDQIDVLVVPSLNDGRPLVIREAQARGAVVVASRVGAIPELIEHGVSGLMVRPGDVVGLVSAVRRLAGDPALRAALGQGGRERALAQSDLSRSMPAYLAAILGDEAPAAARG